eukprot:TRINITY_DN8349_c0_g1_i4.p1 TRINITY_DN8349_c0_g1~~TRINITY_DN8349_c0_g1_i4.p1  ORF type:complete len:113 (+),score=7.72 TRINITY_DN8349_c0_g1_i4:139-477(+)
MSMIKRLLKLKKGSTWSFIPVDFYLPVFIMSVMLSPFNKIRPLKDKPYQVEVGRTQKHTYLLSVTLFYIDLFSVIKNNVHVFVKTLLLSQYKHGELFQHTTITPSNLISVCS